MQDEAGSQAKFSRFMGGREPRDSRPVDRPHVTKCTGEESIPIAAAPQAQYPDRVLVSRVALGTQTEAIRRYAMSLSKHVKAVIKMKSPVEHPSFDAFVIEVKTGHGQLIRDPSKWREGMTMKAFIGRVREHQEDERVLAPAPEEFVDAETMPIETGDDGEAK